MEFVHLLSSTIEDAGIEKPVSVDAIVNDQWEYSGRYRATVNGSVTNLTLDKNAEWVEEPNRKTKLAQRIGELIENYCE